MRPGYTPHEDVARFRPSRVLQADGQGPAPRRAGLSWSEARQVPRPPEGAAKPFSARARRDLAPDQGPATASAKESAQASAKETIRPPAKKPPGKEPDAANPREKDQGPTTDTTPEWRSAARPRTKAERPRSRAEREPRPKPQAPPADAESTLDTLGESLSALSIKDRRVEVWC